MHWQQRLEQLSVGHKLLLALIVLLAASLLAANLAFMTAGYWISRHSRVPQNLQTLARLIATPELSHQALTDPQAAQTLLARLSEYPPLQAAAIYDAQGERLAQYCYGAPLNTPKRLQNIDIWQARNGHITSITALPQANNASGHLLLIATTELPDAFYTALFSAGLAILWVSLFLWLWGSRHIRRLITQPIRRLERLSRQVTTEENYALRAAPAAPQTQDEIGHLANAFNTMLSRMESREHQLRQAHADVQAALQRSEHLAQETRQTNQQLAREIQGRRRIEKKLMGFQNYLNNIINSMPSALIAVDEHLHITQWNQQASLLSGTASDDAVDQPIAHAFPLLKNFERPIRQAALRQEIQKNERITQERKHYELSFYPLIGGDGLGAVIRIDDITERLNLEELMVQSEKMRSVGGLAAGMAHEINNPLGAIVHNVQNIRRRLTPDLAKNTEAAQQLGVDLTQLNQYLQIRQIPQQLEHIQEAANRAAKTVSHMLGFTRMSKRQLLPCALPAVIEQAIGIADNDFNLSEGFDFRAIHIQRDFDPELGPVPCIANELEQVLLNLLKNAAQAIRQTPHAPSGRICLRTRLNPPWAEIQVEDNGCGMPESIRQRIFEPFFTTKDLGQGTGLGLFVSYFIITHNHQGQMEVQSTQGQGSLFNIRLPLTAFCSIPSKECSS